MDPQIFKVWYNDLTSYLRQHITDNQPVVVIALSRKMPRLISYIADKILSKEEAETLHNYLHHPNCYYTTEHGIPFVFSDSRLLDAEVLVLDDMIITGDTLSRVSDEILALTGRRPCCLSLYALNKPGEKEELEYNISEKLPIRKTDIDELRQIMRDHSREIENTGLPIDMEFPILHVQPVLKSTSVSNEIFEPMIKSLRISDSDARYYPMQVDENTRDFTQLVESDINRLYNNDFAKIRLFRNDTEVRTVCYAPNILGDMQIMSTNLFVSQAYRQLWQKILFSVVSDPVKDRYDYAITEEDRLRHRLSKRIRRSLVVMANYLFSLSMMIRVKKSYTRALTEGMYSAEIKQEDVALLLGPALASVCVSDLNAFYRSGIESTSIRHEINISDLLVPDEIKGDYVFLSTERIFRAKTVKEAVEGIFAAAYIVCSDMDSNKYMPEDYKPVLESFESLYCKPSKKFREEEGEREINAAVDELIDQGYVVPVYETSEDRNGTRYWRRYFRATHTACLFAD